MTQETQTLQVFRDGELDAEYLALKQAQERRERLSNIGHGTLHVFKALGENISRNIGQTVSDVLTNIDLDIYDHEHGTQLRHEWHAQRTAEANEAMRERVGLR